MSFAVISGYINRILQSFDMEDIKLISTFLSSHFFLFQDKLSWEKKRVHD